MNNADNDATFEATHGTIDYIAYRDAERATYYATDLATDLATARTIVATDSSTASTLVAAIDHAISGTKL